MSPGQAQAFIQCQSIIVQTQIELEAMKVANLERENQGKAPAYGESDFLNLQQNLISRISDQSGWITC